MGWKLVNDPTLPKGVYSAPAPPPPPPPPPPPSPPPQQQQQVALGGLALPLTAPSTSLRHLWIDGVRAVRTRRNATIALPGMALDVPLPPPPPSPSAGCTVSLTKQESKVKCTAGESYGCTGNATSSTSVWVAGGCRGQFMCNGGGASHRALECASDGEKKATCPCNKQQQQQQQQEEHDRANCAACSYV